MTSTNLWVRADAPPATAALISAGYSRRLAPLLARRGVQDAAQARSFLHPTPDQLHDPMLLEGMQAATDRLARAIDEGERVAVVGDYDVDGVSGTALLTASLRAAGLEVEAILPHRMAEGYGLQPVHVERAKERGCSVLVTVDCGTSSAEAIEQARDVGIEVIVTDHHLPPAGFPEHAIQINPRQQGCRYPFPELSGAGLALKLASALLARSGRRVPVAPLLRIACLGTIADIVPLIGENRVIASLGLRALAQARSEGLLALMKVAGVRPPVRADHVGFRLGPRINAAGRLDYASKALDLLMTRDAGRAAALAEELDQWNKLRQEEEQRAVDQAMELFVDLDELPGILVASSPEWHRGVVGIAAGRLARHFHRPAILLAEDGDRATGSGRSIPGIHLHQFLDRWRDRLERFGGHAAAIGMTVACSRLPELREAWIEGARWDPDLLVKRYEFEVDLGVKAADLNGELLAELEQLEPHGAENPAPLVRIGELELYGDARVFGNGHVSALARGRDGGRVRLVAWRWADRVADLEGRFDVLGRVGWDDWVEAPALQLVDARPHDADAGDDGSAPLGSGAAPPSETTH